MTNSENNLFPNLPERLKGLSGLAENLWWSWHPAARMLFKMLNRQAWKESGHNPDKMLKELPKEILEYYAQDPEYLRCRAGANAFSNQAVRDNEVGRERATRQVVQRGLENRHAITINARLVKAFSGYLNVGWVLFETHDPKIAPLGHFICQPPLAAAVVDANALADAAVGQHVLGRLLVQLRQ